MPGEALTEADLSKSLDTSRGTVREALRQLQQSGLVEIFPYRGAFVTRLTPHKAWEIYTLRATLEPMAVRLAFEYNPYTQDDFDQFEALVLRMSGLSSRGPGLYETVRADLEFHRVLCERCTNGLLLEMIRNLQALTMLFILTTKIYHSDRVDDAISHRRLLDGISRGDQDLAAELLRKHIIDAGQSLVSCMEESPELANPEKEAQ
jgi:DNA-binding GntR family transcriptional regulator